MKDRKSGGMPANELTDMHGELASKFKLLLPINPVHFGQMIHPYKAYLANFPNKHFSFPELWEVYLNQIAAGLERASGRELFANELSCLCFWMVKSPNQGFMSFEDSKELMHAFRFHRMETQADFRQEFKSLLAKNPKELLKDEDDFIMRFDLARQIFLERGL